MTTTNFSARLLGPPAESATAARPGENPGRAPSAQQRWATARHRLGEQLRAIDGSRAVIATAALADTARPARLDADHSSLVAASPTPSANCSKPATNSPRPPQTQRTPMPEPTQHADALRAAGHPEAADLVEKLDAQNLVDNEAPTPQSITDLISTGFRLRREDAAA